jgi:hypothetical protein
LQPSSILRCKFRGWPRFLVSVGTDLSPGTNDIKYLVYIPRFRYVAYVARYSAVISMATIRSRQLHATERDMKAPKKSTRQKAAEAAAMAEFDLNDEQRRRLVLQERN